MDPPSPRLRWTSCGREVFRWRFQTCFGDQNVPTPSIKTKKNISVFYHSEKRHQILATKYPENNILIYNKRRDFFDVYIDKVYKASVDIKF